MTNTIFGGLNRITYFWPLCNFGIPGTLFCFYLNYLNKCSVFQLVILWIHSVVLSLLGTREWFHGRQFFPGLGMGGWFLDDSSELHLLCTFFSFVHFISNLMLPLIWWKVPVTAQTLGAPALVTKLRTVVNSSGTHTSTMSSVFLHFALAFVNPW